MLEQKTITSVNHPIYGTVTIPGSKSITNRALLLAALAKGKTKLSGVLFSRDTLVGINVLKSLGIQIIVDEVSHTCIVQGGDGQFPNKDAEIYFEDAGTATRFTIAICAAIKGRYRFYASERMMARPIKALVDILSKQGVIFEFESEPGHMPFIMTSYGLKGGKVRVPGCESSQFLSGLLLSAPFAKHPMQLVSESTHQQPYVQMTCQMMRDFGVPVSFVAHHYEISTQTHYQGQQYVIEPDASTASYFFAMAAVTQGHVTVKNYKRKGLQGDTQFLFVLKEMGCHIEDQQNGVTVIGPEILKGVEVNMRTFSDTFMTIACIAPFATSKTKITGIAHTRLQESDRIDAISAGLRRLGVDVEFTEDSLTVYPSKPHGGVIETFNDHRIAMSLSLIGLKVGNVVINDPGCVGKTCPDYFKLLSELSVSQA